MGPELVTSSRHAARSEPFDSITISLASPQTVRSWSSGEVTRPETVDRETLAPVRDGLFCARIFGPTGDHECLCGPSPDVPPGESFCGTCGVEFTVSRVRRERMGHIELAAPVVHVWFLTSPPSRIGLLLDIPRKHLERILSFELYVVLEPGLTSLKERQLLSEDEYRRALAESGEDRFWASTGAGAIQEMLRAFDLERAADDLTARIAALGRKPRRQARTRRLAILARRLTLIEAFIQSGDRPDWMVLTVLPVLPPDLRPLVPMADGGLAPSDLNVLYARVIHRNNRLKRLIEQQAPESVLRSGQRRLQEAVDALLDNRLRGRPMTGADRRPLASLADRLRGPQGRFRQSQRAEHVAFSGRSVIVPGPELKLHQCGLPKTMALALFRPFIDARLDARGLSAPAKQATILSEPDRPEVWDILDEVIRDHPVMLSRPPALHRPRLQAFEPVLIEGKAIQLHPLVCPAFNADFDGDEMTVHVPLSLAAQREARALMISTNTILHPANGQPIIVPTQDIVLGIYDLSIRLDGEPGEGMVFADIGEIEHALAANAITVHTKVKYRFASIDEDGKRYTKIGDTTPGRAMLGQLLPRHGKVTFDVVNTTMTRKAISNAIEKVYRHCGQRETVTFCDRLMTLGFSQASKSGFSFGKNDMVVPETKPAIIEETRDRNRDYQGQFDDGLITQDEKHDRVVDAWAKCSDRLAMAMMARISAEEKDETGRTLPMNSIYMMYRSGARGSPAQMKQLAAMRGLMSKPSGEIIESGVISNLKEGLDGFEYFSTTYGARGGRLETARKRAHSGTLARRLLDVAQDVVITEPDCGTTNGISMRAITDDGRVVASLPSRIMGRFSAKDLVDTAGGVIVPAGTMIEECHFEPIRDHYTAFGDREVKIRSVITCESADGVCATCYGRDLARGTPVTIGEAVGVIAAQSFGERGTHLNLRIPTFHIGAAQIADMSFIESYFDGVVKTRNRNVARNSDGDLIAMARNMSIVIAEPDGTERDVHRIPYGARLKVDEGDMVKRGQRIAEWDNSIRPIVAEADGFIAYEDLIEGASTAETADESTGITKRVVTDWRANPRSGNLRPCIVIHDAKGKPVKLARGGEARYPLPVDSIVAADPGSKIHAGDVIARIPREPAKTRNNILGRPRLTELFEARRPKDAAIVAKKSGTIQFGRASTNKLRITLNPADGSKAIEYLVDKGMHIHLQDGDIVEKGDYIVDGSPAPHDILAIMGVEDLTTYIVYEIQEVYRLHSQNIDDKQIEVIVRQMLQTVAIDDPGASAYRAGEQVDKTAVRRTNERLVAEGKPPATWHPVLLGITQASLRKRSVLAAATLQDPTRVLTEAAVHGTSDPLRGLRENVIAGRLIPAGTGFDGEA